MQVLQKLNDNPKRYDIIYLITNEQKLLVFDMKSETMQVMGLYAHLERMANKAFELYKGIRQ